MLAGSVRLCRRSSSAVCHILPTRTPYRKPSPLSCSGHASVVRPLQTRSRTTMAPSQVNKTAHPFERADLEGVLTRRFFICPSFEIYNGVAGLFDLGPPGSALQANIIDAWRKHFIIEEEMLEIETTALTLSEVLKTSGHVDKFTDWKCDDVKTGQIFRADHLVEAVLESRLAGDRAARGEAEKVKTAEELEAEVKSKKKKVKSTAVKLDDSVVADYESVLAQIDNYTGEQLGELITKYNIKSPETGNDLTKPVEFNLMFDTLIGPTGYMKGYLRPETAQGHFVNFNRLLEFNNAKVPFASAQIGKSFRNEIAPRQGLLRVREFTMAEIEHFVDPHDKSHARFSEVKDQKLSLLPKDVQSAGKSDLTEMTIGDAVGKGIVNNETLGYFLVRVYLFMIKIGIDPARMRFRQHMANEMAHYAADCWDLEIHSSYGWIECVGCADRSAYDLTKHAARTSTKMVVRVPLPEPVEVDEIRASFDRKKMGPVFKKDAKIIEDTVAAYDDARLECVEQELAKDGKTKIEAADGKTYELTSDLISITRQKTKQFTRDFVPNVIEPSFGIGRILYSLLEHSYWARAEDSQRAVMSFPPLIAPVKVLIVPLSNNDAFKPLIRQVQSKLRAHGIASRIDDSGASIGKRYARNDELGTPFGCTIDFASVKNNTMTLRERDSTSQRIGSIDEVVAVVNDLCDARATWAQACERLPEFSGDQDV
ncbi:uncharacterized protein L969DRAFT_93235 [Mixia osmundae IAM 14324]|uniref:glycine--tRNA ligase n=1 Tax=Mixia osmundae (strain CBS 9802 / IAM 14324 / JCM 22182 / KY 12970) TaxID=764103 RepID=G7E5P6_MIXOS|nr:uncharacterized protein L969DRAFT_93235 [Mixia osmundae IAM 14324]KEI40696.1 hypothetical protein L969DRAFT_93235 [Mixia osmundae IAM 14324]GAA98156.1 hypothetical protein E5Q_04839 [Mixia osmundae IAM 14324]